MAIHKTHPLSQYLHIKNKKWRKRSCGIICLAMLLGYFNKKRSPDRLLKTGLKLTFFYKRKKYLAYAPAFGWTHWGLVRLAKKSNLNGAVYDWSTDNDWCKKSSKKTAFNKVIDLLKKQPVIVSMRKTFNKKGAHLVVLTGYDNKKIFYNDPDHKLQSYSGSHISKTNFLRNWTKRAIVIY